ncbi:hypothetical protein HN784_02165 [bacterium]|jgi:hypothetical protein|nr:hypothetical protein [bacterium]MBT6755948.1 hypothetical protein [Candidatus Paceibacterota bacterium]MBT7038183.1 hypothetical protein [bacterium]MBT7431624.1 hypothetical protein [bacterium]MBT7992322.1 hypothetical protein [bacterium]
MKNLFKIVSSLLFSLFLYFGYCASVSFAGSSDEVILKEVITDEAGIFEVFHEKTLSKELSVAMRILSGSRIFLYTRPQMEPSEDSFLTELFEVNQLKDRDILLVFFYEKSNNVANFRIFCGFEMQQVLNKKHEAQIINHMSVHLRRKNFGQAFHAGIRYLNKIAPELKKDLDFLFNQNKEVVVKKKATNKAKSAVFSRIPNKRSGETYTIPSLKGFIVDSAKVLNPYDKWVISRTLKEIKETSPQKTKVVLYTMNSIECKECDNKTLYDQLSQKWALEKAAILIVFSVFNGIDGEFGKFCLKFIPSSDAAVYLSQKNTDSIELKMSEFIKKRDFSKGLLEGTRLLKTRIHFIEEVSLLSENEMVTGDLNLISPTKLFLKKYTFKNSVGLKNIFYLSTKVILISLLILFIFAKLLKAFTRKTPVDLSKEAEDKIKTARILEIISEQKSK